MSPLAEAMLAAAGTATASEITEACEEIEFFLIAEDEARADDAARRISEREHEAQAQEEGHAAYLRLAAAMGLEGPA